MSTTTKSKAAKVRQITNKSKYTDLHTITNNLCSPACFKQKILSDYYSDDIYRKDLHLLPHWSHN